MLLEKKNSTYSFFYLYHLRKCDWSETVSEWDDNIAAWVGPCAEVSDRDFCWAKR